MARKLNLKQQRFVDFYLGDANGNAAEAARLAGYADPAPTACNLLKHPLIAELIKERLEKSAMSAGEVLERLSDIARGSMADFIGDDLNVAWFARIDLEKAKKAGKLGLIKKLKIDEKGIALELYDARAALVDLGRYHKLFTDRHEIADLDEAIERELEKLAARSKEKVPRAPAGKRNQPKRADRRGKDTA